MKRLAILALLVSGTALAAKAFEGNNETATYACPKDGGAVITGNKNTITFTGQCAKIVVQGNDNTLTIASAQGVSVQGNHNTIAIDATDTIRTSGNNNKITWKKAIAAKVPEISDPGTNNTIGRAK